MKKFLQFGFLPRSPDFALLLLRVFLGAGMLYLHGWSKVTGFSGMSGSFADPFGLGPTFSLVLVIFAEVVCAALVVIGLFTRFAALVLAINMGVAFGVAHKFALSGPGSGEMATLYLAGFLAIFIAGAGKYSVDRQ